MPERWQLELRKLRAVEPSSSLWERVQARPTRDGEPPLRRRILATVVAFALFLGAGVFAWTALRPAGIRDRPGAADDPEVLMAEGELAVFGDPPTAVLSFAGESQTGTWVDYCWTDEAGEICGEGLPEDPPHRFMKLVALAPIALKGDWRSLAAQYEPIGENGRPIEFTKLDLVEGDGSVNVPDDPGRYELWVSADWPEGDALFRFGVEIVVERDVSDGAPGASDVLRIACRDGTVEVPTPVVAARPEGVLVSAENDRAVVVEFHRLDVEPGSAFGGPIGHTARTWPIEPGRFEVGCLEDDRQSYADVPTATFEVVDPNGYWVGFSADCDRAGVREFAAYDGGGADYVDDPSAIRGTLTGLDEEDEVRLPGYVEGSGSKDGRYVIVRDGRVIGHVFVGLSDTDDPIGAGLTEVTGEGCADSGLGDVSERDGSRLQCGGTQPEPFEAPGGPRAVPGGEAYINANLSGMRVDDDVQQISFIEGTEWDGAWTVTRAGRFVALVSFPSLDGVACDGSGIGGT
jgi:hypothetical protein